MCFPIMQCQTPFLTFVCVIVLLLSFPFARTACLPAEIQKLAVMTVQVNVQDGGAMDVSYQADAVPVQWIGSDATLIATLVLQVGTAY